MPVTARLSRKFYDTFGEDVTNELVDWFNKVDATYRSELRDITEANVVRFDARLDINAAHVFGWNPDLVNLAHLANPIGR